MYNVGFASDLDDPDAVPTATGTMDKIVKIRVLLSLLGLGEIARGGDKRKATSTTTTTNGGDDNGQFDNAEQEGEDTPQDIIWDTLSNAQTNKFNGTKQDEWVRIIAGIVKSKMYLLDPTTKVDFFSEKQIKKTSHSILKDVTNAAKKAQALKFEMEIKGLVTIEDYIPEYLPMKYRLLSPSDLKSVLTKRNHDDEEEEGSKRYDSFMPTG